jgi:CRP/FNR family transcriptional regulator, anaerobic regulatory protein
MNSDYRQYLLTIAPFSDSELDEILSRTELRKFLAGEVLLHAGEVCAHVYWVKKGCLRLYCLGNAGKEFNVLFAFENETIADKLSFLRKSPSEFSIDAVEDSEVILLHEESVSHLHEHIPNFTKVVQTATEHQLLGTQQRLLQMLTKTAEERIQYFLNHDPYIFDRLPVEMIASFLGIELREFRHLLRQALEDKDGASS